MTLAYDILINVYRSDEEGTRIGCGMGPIITDEARHKVEGIPGVSEAKVELVWEPLWNREMMSETALLQLGIL